MPEPLRKPGTALQLLAEMPDWATVRETAPCLTVAEATAIMVDILDKIKRGELQRPYPLNIRHTMNICAAVIAREAAP